MFSVAALNGCGSAANEKGTINTNPGPAKPTPVSGKPLPTKTEADLSQRAMEELMRFRRVTHYMISKPTSGHDFKENCLVYDTSDTGFRYLSVNHQNCTWNDIAGDDNKQIQWNLTGGEVFTANADQSITETSHLILTALRLPAKTQAFKAKYERTSKLVPATGGAFGFQSDVVIGDAKVTKQDLFTSHLEAKWSQVGGAIRIPTAQAELKFSVRPGAVGKAADTTLYTLAPTSEISFEGEGFCLRPIGTFRWTKTVEDKAVSSGTLTTSKEGLRNGTDPATKVTPWSSCLEMTPF